MIDLIVRDNGCGIPAEKLPRIFDAFFTTKAGPDASGKGGTGLGLSTCRDILEAHHGRIRVDSTVGKGTAFTLKLPTVTKATGNASPCRSDHHPLAIAGPGRRGETAKRAGAVSLRIAKPQAAAPT